LVIIDDSTADVRWFELMVREAGFDYDLKSYPTVAAAARDVGSLAEHFCPALFVSVVLPWLSFDEACATLRAMPEFGSVPIIGLVDSDYEVKLAQHAGVEACLWKPVEVSTLKPLLAQAAARATLSRAATAG
jgi:CheY-like chemotaxis protein